MTAMSKESAKWWATATEAQKKARRDEAHRWVQEDKKKNPERYVSWTERKRRGERMPGPVSAKEIARARVAALNKKNQGEDTVTPGSRGGSSYSRSPERNSPNVPRDQYATSIPRLDRRSTGNRRFNI